MWFAEGARPPDADAADTSYVLGPSSAQHAGLHRNRSQLRHKVAIRFSIEGDLRFISHHDTMRLFERALARSRLPVRYSEGFNPRAKLSLPLPRAVGVTTGADLLVVELTEPVVPTQAMARLNEQMPVGVQLLEAWPVPAGGTLQPEQVEYQVPVPTEHTAQVSEAVQRLLAATTWPICRQARADKPAKTIDLKGYVLGAAVENGVLRWTARIAAEGSLRPGELLTALGLDESALRHHIQRVHVTWRMPQEQPKAAALPDVSAECP